jgi:uncharacterized protein
MNTNRNPAGWFEIYVQDMNRAKNFTKIRFSLLSNTWRVILILTCGRFRCSRTTPGCAGALARMEGKDSGAGGTIIYFSCDDCAVEAARAVQNGGRIQKDKLSIGQYGFIALIYDTEGNMIGLHSMK